MKEENNINILELLKVISEEIKETRKNSSDHIQKLEQINKSIIKISDICKNLKVNDKDTITFKVSNLPAKTS